MKPDQVPDPTHTVSDAIGRFLVRAGVRDGFGVVGNGNLPFIEGFAAAGGRYESARHEGGAMTMADVYFRTTGRIGLCTTTIGPGLTNAGTGLTEAVKNGSGALLVCGDAPAGRNRPVDVDQLAFARVLGVPAFRVDDPAAALMTAAAALEVARSRSCPVVLCLAANVLTAPLPASAVAPPPAHRAVEPPPPGDLSAVLKAVTAARRPLFIGGRGAAGAEKPVAELADRLGALLATTLLARGLFHGHPALLGVSGGFASPGAAALIGEADLVLGFGAGLNDWTLDGGALLDPQATVIQIDSAAGPVSRHARLRVTGDAAEVAAALLDSLATAGSPAPAWRDEVAERVARAGWEHESHLDAGTADRIDPRTLTRALAPLLPENRTIVTDGGHFIGWPARYWPVRDPTEFAFPGVGFQSIGLGLPGAVGAAVGRPERVPVLAVGDGGLLMALADLETLIRVVPSALVVIYDDAAYGAESHVTVLPDGGRGSVVFDDTDFAGIARALGAQALVVRSVADLDPVRAWRDAGCCGVLVLDCKIVREVVGEFLAGWGRVLRGTR